MILAAPIVIPFAKALGLSIGTLGMAKATDMINNYIQENPEQSVKILSTIVPSIGIGQTVMNEEKISLEDLDEMTDEEAQDLSKEEKAELMKQAGKSGSKDKRQTMIDISEKLGLSGENKDKQDIEYEVDERYEGGVEEVSKPKFDYKKFFRKRRSNGGPLNDDEEYQQSELSKRVNELMDEGFDFGEAVKEAMKEGYKDGGSIGIEVLFGPKVPAAPSQLVEESEIVLGYRGDAAYRSGSEQSKSIGQGNVGSKASFGGGKGTDRSGRSEGISGVDRSKVTQEQNINQLKNQLGIKDPNLIQKTFNKYNSLPFGVKTAINTMAPVELMKIFNIGNAINTGVNQLKNPVLTDEDLTLGATEEISFEGNSPFMRNQINERVIAAENEYLKQGKMPPEFLGDKIRMNMELGNYKGYMGPGFEEGGRVGLFMGGSPLEGEALSIYNSMKAYGNDDQTIADKLQSLGMYTPPGGSTPPETTPNIIGSQINQGGGDKPMIQPFRQDPRVDAAFEAYQRNQGLKAMGIDDPFADEISLQGAYYEDMPNVDLSPGKQTLGGKIKSGIGEIMNYPLVKGLSMMTPFGFAKQGLNALKGLMPINQRAIAENVAGNMGIAVDDIGRIVNTGNYQDPSNVMAGYNLNKMTDETFDKRIDTISGTLSEKYGLGANEIKGILEGTLSEEELNAINAKAIMPGTTQTTNLIKQLRSINIAKDKNKFIQDIAKKEAERQRVEKERKEAFAQAERDRKKYADIEAAISRGDRVDDRDRPTSGPTAVGAGMGVGGGYASDFGFLKDGGLATMFKRKR